MMQQHIGLAVFIVLGLWASSVFSIPNCPFPGAAFPKPTNLAKSPTVQAALKNLTAAFETYDQTAHNNPNGTSVSI
jgi:hypothetical protein